MTVVGIEQAIAGPSEVSSTIVSLLGLLSDSVILTAGQRTDVQQAIEWLLQQKTGAANWETISHTADIVTILERFGGYQSEIDEAVAWLKQRQNPDGGWGEYESTIQITAGVVLALIQTGNQGPETARAVQWLLAVQNADGGWPILAGIPNSSTITRQLLPCVRWPLPTIRRVRNWRYRLINRHINPVKR